MRRREHWSHVVGFDDAPFLPDQWGSVLVVGAVYAGERLDGVLNVQRARGDLIRGQMSDSGSCVFDLGAARSTRVTSI